MVPPARSSALQELAYVTPGAAAGAAAGPGAAPAGGLGSLYGTDVAQLGGANVNSAQGLASALGDLNLGYGTAGRVNQDVFDEARPARADAAGVGSTRWHSLRSTGR